MYSEHEFQNLQQNPKIEKVRLDAMYFQLLEMLSTMCPCEKLVSRVIIHSNSWDLLGSMYLERRDHVLLLEASSGLNVLLKL